MTNKAQKQRFAAVILAAGKGTRMKSSLPKVMHTLAGMPLIAHVVNTATQAGADKIVVVTAADMDTVHHAALRENPRCSFAIQSKQLGTGHAVASARKALTGYKGPVLVLYGDTPLLSPRTLQKLLQTLKGKNKPTVAVLGMRPAHANEYGRLVLDASGNLDRIVEYKDATAAERKNPLCNSGVMAIQGGVLFGLLNKLSNKNAKKEYYLTDIIAHARKAGHHCAALEAPMEELLGINSRAELAEAEQTLQRLLRTQAMENGATLVAPETVFLSKDTRLGADTVVHPFVVFGPNVRVGRNVAVRSYSHIEGTYVGDNAIIGPFARLRPGTELAEQVHVGNFVEIKNSYVDTGSKINHLSYVGDATVGQASNIGAGTITCNYDGKNKYQTFIGDNVFIGSNSALVAPVTIGDDAVVGAGSVITRDVEEGALALARSLQTNKEGWASRYSKKK